MCLQPLTNMQNIIPTKDTVIQGLTAGVKVLSSIMGLAAYDSYIPQKYLPVAFLVFTLASAFKEGATTIIAYLRGDKITLAPAATPSGTVPATPEVK